MSMQMCIYIYAFHNIMSMQMDAVEYWLKIQENFQVTHFILTTGQNGLFCIRVAKLRRCGI